MRLKIFVLFLLTAAASGLSAASLEAYTDVDESYVGQPVTLTVRIMSDEQVSRPQLPSLKEFEIQDAGESRYEQRTMGTGGSSKTVTVEYTWRLIPTRTGQFTIPPITVSLGKERVKSKSIFLTVKAPEQIEGYYLFLTADRNQSFPMMPVRVQLKWLFSSEVSRPDFIIPFFKNSKIKISDLPPPSSQTSDIFKFSVDGHTIYAVQSAELYDGKQYASLSMSWDILPEVSGTLHLNPITLSFQRGDLNRQGRKIYVNAAIPSNSLDIEIQTLPDKLENYPGGILVADDRLQISASLDQNKIYPGDPLELTLQFKGLNNPELTDFKGVGSLPETRGIIKADSAGLIQEISGSVKTVHQKIRYISSDQNEFPELVIPYFSIKSGKVELCHCQSVSITVLKLENQPVRLPETDLETANATLSPVDQIEINGNAAVSIQGGAPKAVDLLFRFKIQIVIFLLFAVFVTLLLPLFAGGLGQWRVAASSQALKNLQDSIELYKKEETRDQSLMVYERFWKWIDSLPFTECESKNKEDVLAWIKRSVSKDFYRDFQSFILYLECFWKPDDPETWKREYNNIPERLLKELKIKGKKSHEKI